MLLNLKRAYVRLYSFQQARDVTELLLAVDPAALTELRNRGLLAYHLNDLPSALRDLQNYLHLQGRRARRRQTRRARACLGTRQGAPPPRRLAQLTGTGTSLADTH